jgi:hypothetical protein
VTNVARRGACTFEDAFGNGAVLLQHGLVVDAKIHGFEEGDQELPLQK